MLEKTIKSLKAFSTPNRVSIAVCMTVAFVGWFLTKMSKIYSDQYILKIEYVVPQSYTFGQDPPQRLIADVRASGWSLLSLALSGERDSLSIIASELSGKSTSSKTLLNEKLSRLDGDEIAILGTDPEQISFQLVAQESKKVPVEIKGKISLQGQYQWKTPLQIEPDSVIVYGSADQLNNIKSWPTKNFVRENIQQDFSEVISLVESSPSIGVDVNAILVTGLVDQITEKEVYVPIEVTDSLKGQISIFPDQVLVKVNLGLSKYDSLDPGEFILLAEIDPENKNSLRVRMKKAPTYVTYLSHAPTNVDFIKTNP
jgi:hypothetical protein